MKEIFESLREYMRHPYFAPYFIRAENMASVGKFEVPNKIDCGSICRYDIGHGRRETCPGLVVHDRFFQNHFLHCGGVLFERDHLRKLRMEPESPTIFRCEDGWFRKNSRRFHELGIKFAHDGSILTVEDEASLCACALSGAKMPGIKTLLDKHGCDLQKLG